MELTEGFRAAPGRCATCATSAHGPVIDLQVNDLGVYARTHRMYLCATCALQVAEMIAPIAGRAVVASDMRADYLYVQDRLAAVERERDEAIERLNSIRGAIETVDL